MNRKLFLPLILVFTGCALITEPDISTSDVFLIAPADNLVTETATHTFWWDYVQDAQNYNLIIVSPAWDSVVTLVADTNLTSNKFVMTLPPGKYVWGVSAYNHSSATSYFIRDLTIDTTSDLSKQFVTLKSPGDNFATNDPNLVFEWYKVDIANSYLFDIKIGDWQGVNVIPTRITENDTVHLTLDEGAYAWGVQARNDFSSTVHTVQNLLVDMTAPGKPIINQPAINGDTIPSNDLKIKWYHPETSLSAISDSVYIATDSANFASTIKDFFITKNQEVPISNYSTGYYFVRLNSFDAAGNVGLSTDIKRFYVP